MKVTKCVGIVREVYNKWERRAPLCPQHVQELTKKGIQVLVQPSTTRIFTNEEYEAAGATITTDLGNAQLILGVKQVPQEQLLPEKTYMFFSHTIKAQSENMGLLDEILKQKIRLIDYECIAESNGRRLIAFGSYAGRAGMINTFRGIGERLLARGYSTPFLNIASTYMYGDLDSAKEAIERAGKYIKHQGLPHDIAPMTFVFTGNGNVSQGAREIFELMPHEMVDPLELATLPKDQHKIYACVAQEQHMVESLSGESVQRERYFQSPELFRPVFHQNILPYASVIVNCMYWDNRYPRLITKEQIRDLHAGGNSKLIGVGDISCDINGSIEFLEQSTTIENPFFLYDVTQDSVQDKLDGDGVMMMGVDILPSELPRESSTYFGDRLVPFVEALLGKDVTQPIQQQPDIPEELQRACIADNGKIMPSYEYIYKMRAERERSISLASAQELESNAGSTCIYLKGHLFDTGVINQMLNLIEEKNGHFFIVDWQIRPNQSEDIHSSAIVQVSMGSRQQLDEIIGQIKTLCKVTPGAQAMIKELPDYCKGNYSKTIVNSSSSRKESASGPVYVEETKRKNILCLGAGLVATPLLEYLSRTNENQIQVVSAIEGEAAAAAEALGRRNVIGKRLNAKQDAQKIDVMCSEADCVVSLLPATMHADIAKSCLAHGTPLVTASYVSPEMKKLDEEARKQGIPILCEMGLDPGMDHMSAMKVIDDVKAQGGEIVSFSSVCGGLPAPEAADNPIGYKFSWSPRGVLTAAQNAARYRHNGNIVEVPGEEMLSKAELVHFLPALSLEQLPNRDSVPYADIYGIPQAASIFRGTLRYAGWSNIMYQCKKKGLLDSSPRNLPDTWIEVMNSLNNDITLDIDAQQFFQWLGLTSDTPVENRGTIMDSFCALLEKNLSYQSGERDMAVMHHEFGVKYGATTKTLSSTFIGYGKENGETIMAKTVGVTAAIGVELILANAIQSNGVLTPTTPDIYIPSLAKLEAEGIRFIEKELVK